MRSKKFLKAEQARLVWDAPGLLAGVDEAGRGPLAGPVVAAAVILDDSRPIRGLADSKTLTALQRERLNEQILAKALCCSIAHATVEEIDTHNILQATMIAMRRAVEGLRLKPAKVLVDGNRLPTLDVLAEAVIQGDAFIKSISAASIIAKVHRDKLCQQLHDEFPQYGFAGHKGYGTPEHLEALLRHGACIHHRRSFSPVAAALVRMGAVAIGVRVETTPTQIELRVLPTTPSMLGFGQ
ncbi:ribonuclease HII [Variovorax sp. PAMC28562]|uniref:ribonuclease HII n=1 Tax=Variovorax sp. PAMC28562 TaxID=2762323 RepID=UPI0021C34754